MFQYQLQNPCKFAHKLEKVNRNSKFDSNLVTDRSTASVQYKRPEDHTF